MKNQPIPENDQTLHVLHPLDEHTSGLHTHKFSLTRESLVLNPAIIGLLVNATVSVSSPWAVILVRFSDQHETLPPLTAYENLFTSVGNSKLNMVDFFKDMSHGKLDLNGSRVFGWYTLSASKTNYVGNVYPQPAGKLNRNGLLDAAKAAATANGVDLSKFAGVVVSALGGVDLCGWVGGMAALCDSNSLTPSLLGQEMGHGYGLDHARHNNNTEDYRDPWDVMSTAAYPFMEAANADWGTVGPGLNAWNMRGRGWLDETRVWKTSASSFMNTVQLRPLHEHTRNGWLAIEVDGYLIEFRMRQKWDAAIPRDCVLVHRFEANRSYLMPSSTGSDDLVAGDTFEIGNPKYDFLPYISVTVNSIDPTTHTATLTIVKRAAVKPTQYITVTDIFGGIPVDGDGFIFIGGRVIKIPPRSPMVEVLTHMARYLDVQFYATGVDRAMAEQQDAALSMILASADLLKDMEFVSEHPPGYKTNAKQKGHIG